MDFTKFRFHPHILANIVNAGYTIPTPIQVQAIPEIMKGRDIMGLAQTGTGKTAAFVLPILHRLLHRKPKSIRALIIAPTRELAEQIHQAITELGSGTGLRSVSVYGGVRIHAQIKSLKHADIVVACPGRLLDHINRRTVDLSRLEVLVLDEADQMFDMGFLPDIRRILSHLSKPDRQTLMFSATMPKAILQLANDILNNGVKIQAGNEAPAEAVRHFFYPIARHLKTPLLLNLLGNTRTEAVLVFTRTKHLAMQLSGKLAKAGYHSTSLQGNLSQARRRDAMNGFKSGKYKVLVATDIAARGIDVSNVSHVINYDMPSTPEAYIHRIGRTGRASRSGEAFTFITTEDGGMVRAISRRIGSEIERRTLPAFENSLPDSNRGGKPDRKTPRKWTKAAYSRNKKTSGSRRLIHTNG